ncbi:MAG: tetratricopeptide repeat protein [Mediterranea sp.]|nr:tetratricopeptide repeat protein [Mediterranea sp.]
MENEIKMLLDDAAELINQMNYEEIIKRCDKIIKLDDKNSTVWNNKGYALIDLGRYEEAIGCLDESIRLNPESGAAWSNKGFALDSLGRHEEAIECLDESIRLNPENDVVWSSKGFTLIDLERYEEAIGCLDESIRLNPENGTAWNNKGFALNSLGRHEEAIMYFDKALEINDEHFFAKKNKAVSIMKLHKSHPDKYTIEDAAKCFMEAKRDIYAVLTIPQLDDVEKEEVIISMIRDKDSFFSSVVEKHKIEDPESKSKYEELFVKSCLIISKLQVKEDAKQGIAHYTTKATLKILLLPKEEKKGEPMFRLHSTILSNDRSEGLTLMDYLFGMGKYVIDDGDNVTLAGSFTFNKDRLNQFRLYGKEDKQEATGASIIFKSSFFEENMKAPSSGLSQMASSTSQRDQSQLDLSSKMKDNEEKSDKAALFRCIYVDPETRQVIGLGQKEDYTFYRDKFDGKESDEERKRKEDEVIEEIKNYHRSMEDCLDAVRKSMRELRDMAKELDCAVVGELLIDLRCLTKHVAFEEEQECRIVKVKNLMKDKEVKPNEEYRQLYIDYAPIGNHVQEVCFAPHFENMEVYAAELRRKGIKFSRSKHPLA